MVFAFSAFWLPTSASFVVKAIIATVVADGMLLGFILSRRSYRKRYFARRDRRVFEVRQQWDAMLSGKIPYDTWRLNDFDRQVVEDVVLDAFEAANAEESARLLRFMRATGLIEKRIFEARKYKGWQRMRALVALGRTRAPEGIPALAEGLRDENLETRNAALRGLARAASPEAAEEILSWISEGGLQAPALLVQNALINCCRESPRMLFPYLQHADREVREMLGRVLGEIPTACMKDELITLASDDLPELRAAAARALPAAEQSHAVEVLTELAQDPVWFVRLRAVVALGKVSNSGAVPPLVRALTDSNRLVRMRAAEGLVERKAEMISTFEQVVTTKDRYGMHAYFAALDNADLRKELTAELHRQEAQGNHRATELLGVLSKGPLLPEGDAEEAPQTQAAAAGHS